MRKNFCDVYLKANISRTHLLEHLCASTTSSAFASSLWCQKKKLLSYAVNPAFSSWHFDSCRTLINPLIYIPYALLFIVSNRVDDPGDLPWMVLQEIVSLEFFSWSVSTILNLHTLASPMRKEAYFLVACESKISSHPWKQYGFDHSNSSMIYTSWSQT